MQKLLVCLLSASLAAAVPVGPAQELSVDTILMQVSAFYKLHPTFNFTCDECHRMTLGMASVCKEKGQWDSKGVVPACVDYARPVTLEAGLLKGKCGMVRDFVTDLYSPLDPCSQLTSTANTAPNALCGLLRCYYRNYVPPSTITPAPPSMPSPPLPCPTYMNAVATVCSNASFGSNNSAVHNMCDSYNKTFSQEACRVVVNRLETVSLPLSICGALSTSVNNASITCEKYLNLPVVDPVPEEGYLSWLTFRQTSDITLRDNGVNISSATYGRQCKGNGAIDNLLADWRALCQGRITCTVPNPQRNSTLTEAIHALGCSDEFEVMYTCVPVDDDEAETPAGKLKVHRVFAPANAIYESLTLDCTNEIPAHSALDARKHKPAGPEPLPANPSTDFSTSSLRVRPPASYMTPELLRERTDAKLMSQGQMH